MRRLLIAVLVVLALPAAAQAKEITGFALCGPNGCEKADVAGFGHRPPFTQEGQAAPGPTAFYRLDFTVDGQSAFSSYYESRSGLATFEDGPGHVVWTRLAPRLATAAKEAAKHVEAFPAPRVTGARVGGRRVTDDPASYARLLNIAGPIAVPRTNSGSMGISLEARDPNPWTSVMLLYYPADNILFRDTSTFIKIPAALAADIEAARPLGSGGGPGVPWITIAISSAGALLLAGILIRILRRRAPRGEVAPLH
jgi:hypothetical protein